MSLEHGETKFHKTCSSCGERKPITDFHRRSDTLDGRQYDCRECANGRRSALRDQTGKQPDGTDPVPLYVRVHPRIKEQVVDLADAMGLSQARVVSNLLSLALRQVQQRRG